MNVQPARLSILTTLRGIPESPAWPAIAFALRTTAASLIALYLAFLMNLDDPKWAAMTVWIVAQTDRGMTLSKSQYRVLGTVIGAVMALVLTALFAQSPDLFLLSLAAWIGVCTGVATSLRNFRAYAAVLAGYTAAIIALGAAAAPLHAFDIAVARLLYIVLGIVVEATLASVLAPGKASPDLFARFSQYIAQASKVSAGVLRREADGAAMHKLFAGALALDSAAEFAAAASSTARQELGRLRALAMAVVAQLAASQTLGEQLAQRPDLTDDLIERTVHLLDRVAAEPQGMRTEVTALRAAVDRAILAEASGPSSAPRLTALYQLGQLLAAIDKVVTRSSQTGRAGVSPASVRLAYHRDSVLAWKNGVRAFVAVLAASAFWIWSAWPAGAGFVTIVGVVCALFSTRPNSVSVTLAFVKGAAGAALAAALCNFVLLPAISGFVPLACVVGIFMVSAGLAMCHPRTAAIGSGFAIFFWNFISPVNSTRIDDVAFLNGALATLLGIACAAAVFAILFPTNAEAIRARLHRAARQDLMQMSHGPKNWQPEAWLSRTADRLSRLFAIGSQATPANWENDLRGHVAAWMIGDGVLAIQAFATKHRTARRPVAVILERLHRFDLKRLARVCGAAANRLNRRGCDLADMDKLEFLRTAILLQTMADTVITHAEFLRG